MDAEVAHRRALERLRGQTVVGREAQRADIGRHVGDAQRSRQVAEELEEPRPVGPFHDVPVLLAVKPEVTKSWGAPASSMVAMAP